MAFFVLCFLHSGKFELDICGMYKIFIFCTFTLQNIHLNINIKSDTLSINLVIISIKPMYHIVSSKINMIFLLRYVCI